MPDLTPENLAELQRLYEVAFAVAAPENDWEEWTSKAAEAFPALLEAAAQVARARTLVAEWEARAAFTSASLDKHHDDFWHGMVTRAHKPGCPEDGVPTVRDTRCICYWTWS